MLIKQTKNFKKILDWLPYITFGQKIIACTLYLAGDKSTRLEMENFYRNQLNKIKNKKVN